MPYCPFDENFPSFLFHSLPHTMLFILLSPLPVMFWWNFNSFPPFPQPRSPSSLRSSFSDDRFVDIGRMVYVVVTPTNDPPSPLLLLFLLHSASLCSSLSSTLTSISSKTSPIIRRPYFHPSVLSIRLEDTPVSGYSWSDILPYHWNERLWLINYVSLAFQFLCRPNWNQSIKYFHLFGKS